MAKDSEKNAKVKRPLKVIFNKIYVQLYKTRNIKPKPISKLWNIYAKFSYLSLSFLLPFLVKTDQIR